MTLEQRQRAQEVIRLLRSSRDCLNDAMNAVDPYTGLEQRWRLRDLVVALSEEIDDANKKMLANE